MSSVNRNTMGRGEWPFAPTIWILIFEMLNNTDATGHDITYPRERLIHPREQDAPTAKL